MGKQARLKKTRNSNIVALLKHYYDLAGPVMDARLSADRCLNATRITIEVCNNFGVSARPMVCHSMVMNEAAMRYAEKHGGFPQTRSEMPEDAWVVSAKGPLLWKPDSFGGHLVAIVGGWLVDAASGQFSRPEKNIVLPPVMVMPTTSGFLQGSRPLVFMNDGAKTVVTHRALPDDRSYEGTPGFGDSTHNLEIASAITKALMAQMR